MPIWYYTNAQRHVSYVLYMYIRILWCASFDSEMHHWIWTCNVAGLQLWTSYTAELPSSTRIIGAIVKEDTSIQARSNLHNIMYIHMNTQIPYVSIKIRINALKRSLTPTGDWLIDRLIIVNIICKLAFMREVARCSHMHLNGLKKMNDGTVILLSILIHRWRLRSVIDWLNETFV